MEIKNKFYGLEPRAASMISSLRNIGYTLDTALADVIDNSITAKANNIDILFDIDENDVQIAIVDNGSGMDLDELMLAMTFGSKHPDQIRADDDLGRFGLGLKTASFSQCKSLTVISKTINGVVAAKWDLDHVAQANLWEVELLDVAQQQATYMYDKLGNQGTLVVWEKCDRLINDRPIITENPIYKKFETAESHLSLAFHMFIKKIRITINGRNIASIDPFATHSAATQIHSEELIRYLDKKISVQGFTLPHHTKCSAAEYEKNSLGDYGANQGFYVYRNNRLLIHGTWFKLIAKKDLYKLSRVRIDLPNNLDDIWSIDIKKSSANPPEVIKDQLKLYIEQFTSGSKRVYTSKGHRKHQTQHVVWSKRVDKNKIYYEVNQNHFLVEDLMKSLDSQQKQNFNMILNVINSCLPFEMIFADYSSNPNAIGLENNEEDLLESIKMSLKLLTVNQKYDAAIEILKNTEPFNKYSSDWDAFRETGETK